MLNNAEIINILKNLIETTKEGILGFETSSELTGHPFLRSYFYEAAAYYKYVLTELETTLKLYGGEVYRGEVNSNEPSFTPMQRSWMKLRTSIAANDEQILLKECARGQQIAMNNYCEMLKKPLPVSIKAMIQRHSENVRKNYDLVNFLSDQAK